MTVITITVEDDLTGEREYDVAFNMTARPARQTWAQPAEAAEFEVFQIWDAEGKNVTGGEFDVVAAEARDCYYEQMLERALER